MSAIDRIFSAINPRWDISTSILPYHPLSYVWAPYYRAGETRCALTARYFAGMLSYTFAIVWRVVGLAKEIFVLLCMVCWAITVTLCCRSCFPINVPGMFQNRIARILDSVKVTMSATIGALCPPLGYCLDERIMDDDYCDNNILYFMEPISVEREHLDRLDRLVDDRKAALREEAIRAAFRNAAAKIPANHENTRLHCLYAIGLTELLFDGASLEPLKRGKVVAATGEKNFAACAQEASKLIDTLKPLGKVVVIGHLVTSLLKEDARKAVIAARNSDLSEEELKKLLENYPNISEFDQLASPLLTMVNLLLNEPSIESMFVPEVA